MSCHCGKPLHYTNKTIQAQVQKYVDELGENISVQVLGKGTFLVQRHYIALHGIKSENIDQLGFKKI